MIASAVAGGIALFVVAVTFGWVELFPPEQPSYFFGIEATRDFVARSASLLALGFALAAVALLALRPTTPNLRGLARHLRPAPLKTVLTHWSDNEQRGHLFGYWFGHDMFTPPFKGKDGKPLYPEMTRNAVLFGGTDPGRFNPTYMIFCESFIPARCKPNDPLRPARRQSHHPERPRRRHLPQLHPRPLQRSAQIQYDTPFFQEMLRSQKEREKALYTNGLAKAVAPLDRMLLGFGNAVEKQRRAGTSWFEADHFSDLAALVEKLKPGPTQDDFSKHLARAPRTGNTRAIDRRNRGPTHRQGPRQGPQPPARPGIRSPPETPGGADTLRATQTDPAIREAKLTERRNAYQTASTYLYRADLVKRLPLSTEVAHLVRQDVPTASRIRTGRRILEDAYPGLITRSLGGVYPEIEILTPTPEESARCYNEYMQDAFQRKQARPTQAGRGRPRRRRSRHRERPDVSVMAINALSVPGHLRPTRITSSSSRKVSRSTGCTPTSPRTGSS
jgi:hypothetical protein